MNFASDNLGQDLETWKNQFQLFLQDTESDKKTEKVKTSILLTCIRDKGRSIYSTFNFENEEQKYDLKTVIEKFNTHCQPEKKLTFLTYQFLTCKQKECQRFDEYVTELRQEANKCELGQLTDRLIKDILICGIKDYRLRERMLREQALDLVKAIQAGLSAEETKNH